MKDRNLLQFVAYVSGPLYDSDFYETKAEDSTPTAESRDSDVDESDSGGR